MAGGAVGGGAGGRAVRAWARRAAERLEAEAAGLDAVNVFPVADGDTGTNLARTLRAAVAATGDGAGPGAAGSAGGASAGSAGSAGSVPAAGVGPAGAAAAWRALAGAAVAAAHGNSGVILGQVLRGLAEAAGDPAGSPDPTTTWSGPALARGLRAGATRARAAVAAPEAGTVLDVLDAAAAAADAALAAPAGTPADAGAPAGSARVTGAAAAAARAALARTAAVHPVLARHGVVDAGGAGLVVLLDVLHEVVGGGAPAPPPQLTEPAARLRIGPPVPLRDAPPRPEPSPPAPAAPDAGPGGGIEVMFTLRLGPDAATTDPAGLRDRLAALGTSVVVADDGAGLWSAHVHVDGLAAAAAAVQAGLDPAAPARLADLRLVELPGTRGGRHPAPGRSLVVVPGAAWLPAARAVFAGEAVVVVDPAAAPPAGGGSGPSPTVLTVGDAAVPAWAAGTGPDTTPSVIPVRSLVQAVAAVAVHDPDRPAGADVVAMAEAAGACRWATLSTAGGDGLTLVGRCRAGDVLGHIGEEIVVVGTDRAEVAGVLLDRLLAGGGELVTVLTGPGSEALGEHVARRARQAGDHVDVTVHPVGALPTPLLLGVE